MTSSSLAFFSHLLVARLLTTHWLKFITAHHLEVLTARPDMRSRLYTYGDTLVI